MREVQLVLADQGFKSQEHTPKKKRGQDKKKKAKQRLVIEPEETPLPIPTPPANPVDLKICPKVQWNERMIVETVFSLFTGVLHLKKLTHRLLAPLRARLAYTCAIFNICTAWNGEVKLKIAPFAL